MPFVRIGRFVVNTDADRTGLEHTFILTGKDAETLRRIVDGLVVGNWPPPEAEEPRKTKRRPRKQH
jgi:hypothetical protein